MPWDTRSAETVGPGIDEEYRAWYESCPCCMSETVPDVKNALDKERRARRHADREVATRASAAEVGAASR